MQDNELYRYLLGLESPWEVSRVELSVDGERVDAWADQPKGTRFACPKCDRVHRPTRATRHSLVRSCRAHLLRSSRNAHKEANLDA
jgi:transposase